MSVAGRFSFLAVLMVSITALFYLVHFERRSSSRQEKQDAASAIQLRSSIPDSHPSANELRQDKVVSERKTLMYAIKTIHDPVNNGQ